MPPCIGDLKSTQERIHINECQFLRLVHEFGIQILVHVERLGWSPRRGRLPQTAMLQDFLNYFVLGWGNKMSQPAMLKWAITPALLLGMTMMLADTASAGHNKFEGNGDGTSWLDAANWKFGIPTTAGAEVKLGDGGDPNFQAVVINGAAVSSKVTVGTVEDASLTVNAGTFDVAGEFRIGEGGETGTFTQTDGTTTVYELVFNRDGSGGTANLNISGGVLSVVDDLSHAASGDVNINITGGELKLGEDAFFGDFEDTDSTTTIIISGSGKMVMNVKSDEDWKLGDERLQTTTLDMSGSSIIDADNNKFRMMNHGNFTGTMSGTSSIIVGTISDSRNFSCGQNLSEGSLTLSDNATIVVHGSDMKLAEEDFSIVSLTLLDSAIISLGNDFKMSASDVGDTSGSVASSESYVTVTDTAKIDMGGSLKMANVAELTISGGALGGFDGGQVLVGGLLIDNPLQIAGSNAVVDILGGGFMLFDEDIASLISTLVGTNNIISSGTGSLAWDYNLTNAGQTTVWATGGALDPGDFNGDGDVDGADFLVWQPGESPDPLSAADLALWKANYGTVAPLAAASTAVPEPTSLLLSMVASLVYCLRRRRV